MSRWGQWVFRWVSKCVCDITGSRMQTGPTATPCKCHRPCPAGASWDPRQSHLRDQFRPAWEPFTGTDRHAPPVRLPSFFCHLELSPFSNGLFLSSFVHQTLKHVKPQPPWRPRIADGHGTQSTCRCSASGIPHGRASGVHLLRRHLAWNPQHLLRKCFPSADPLLSQSGPRSSTTGFQSLSTWNCAQFNTL